MSTQQAGRRTTTSRLRRYTQIALGAGIVLGIAAAFGSVWIARVGIVLALVAGVVAVRLAWAEVRRTHAVHGRQALDQMLAHGAQLRTERDRNREVIEILDQHRDEADAQIVELQLRIGQLRTELSSVRGDHAALQADMIERDHRIKRLSEDLAEREEELRVLRGDEGDAEVLAMPRHAAKADWDALPSVEDLWSEGNFPTVVDLPALTLPAASQEMRKHA